MKYDEFAFFNQQLAGMLQSGIPLEGALRQLCSCMRHGELKREMDQLSAELAQGTPLAQALAPRRLPDLYKTLVRVGVAGHDLPGVLTLLADHYHKENSLLTRLKGMMVYPAIVLVAAFGLSLILSLILRSVLNDAAPAGLDWLVPGRTSLATLWVAPSLLGLAVAGLCAGLAIPRLRHLLRWWLPGFREASLAQAASLLALMLRRGTSLDEALGLLQGCEGDSPAGVDLAQWRSRLALGHGKPAEFAAGSRVFPPLFVWLAANAGDDLAKGFSQAGDIYHARAMFRLEMILYAFLPASVLLLGLMIIGQVYPVLQVFRSFAAALDGGGAFE